MILGGFQRTTPIVLNLIIINAIVYFAQEVFGSASADLFALHHSASRSFEPYQLVTHMFMHGGFFHLLFNMLALWMFGTNMERVWGPKRFLTFYLICGLGAAVAQLVNYQVNYGQIELSALDPNQRAYIEEIWRRNYTVGASGAVMGIVAAFGFTFPNSTMFIMPIPFPVKAKWAVIGFIAIDVFGGISRIPGDNIAHFAHVGGALIGVLLAFLYKRSQNNTYY